MSDLQVLLRVHDMIESGEARQRREDRGLSRAEVAAACGIDAATLYRWETGRRRPRRDAAIRYAHVLDMISREPAGVA